MNDPVVLFDHLETASGHRFGVATLNEPASLNALSFEMVKLLTPQLRAWADDDKVLGVLLQGSGDKAFCAGGDLRNLHSTLVECGAGRNPYVEEYFRAEYELDYLIHSYAKPILCWGHGIVMGGGLGLMAGAAHRVVTPQSRLAMPEIGIGFYPDVGGSWFLRRMPGRVGLFLALTGAPLDAADAIFCGLADHFIDHSQKSKVLAKVAETDWHAEPSADRAALARLLADQAGSHSGDMWPQRSRVRAHFDTINALMAGENLSEIAGRLRNLKSDDAWLQAAVAGFARGSPTSAALAFELWQRVPRMSLVEVFRLEYWASLGCCANDDFREGIRALLIDKDKAPKWSPSTLDAVTRAHIDDHLRARFDSAHPLATLD